MRGHIRRRGTRSWAIVIDLGRDPATNKRRQQWTSVKGTKRDAQRRLTELLRRYDTGTWMEPSRITVAEFLERWIQDYAEPNVGPTTLRRYGSVVRNHLSPTLGHLALAELRPDHIVSAHHRWRTNGRVDGTGGLAPHSVLYNHRVLHEALTRAVRWRLLAVNPAAAVDPPRTRRREFPVLTRSQLRALVSAADKCPFGPIVQLATLTGMRQAEILGLRWVDVSLERGDLRVAQTIQWIAGRGFVVQQPKTERGRRTIALSPSAVETLRTVRARQAEIRLRLGPAYRDQGLVFTVGDGGPGRRWR